MHADRLVKKRLNNRHAEILQAREPSLLNLPIPGNLPVVGPLVNALSPLVGAQPTDGSSAPLIDLSALVPPPATKTPVATKPTQPAAPPPAQQPQPPQQPTQAPQPPAAPPSSPPTGGSSPPSNGDGGSNSGGGGNDQQGSGNPNTDPASPPAGGSPASPGQDSPGSGGGQVTSPGGSPITPSATPTTVVVTLPNGSIATLQTQAAVVNAGNLPPTGGGNGVTNASGVTVAGPSGTGITAGGGGGGSHGGSGGSSKGGSGSGSSGSGGSGGSGSNGSDGGGTDDGNGIDGGNGTGAASGHHGISTGVIAAISIIAALFLLLFFFCLCRRRSIRKRIAARSNWFRSKETDADYGVASAGYFKRSSARSSFGTTVEFDPFRQPSPVPPIPLTPDWPLPRHSDQMAQVGDGMISVPPAAVSTSTPASPTIRNGSDRNSVESLISLGGTNENLFAASQVLLVPTRMSGSDSNHSQQDLLTPMSVRPFSPTERWSFPKPPTVQGSPRSSARQSYVDDLPSAATANTFIPPRTSSTSPASYNTASFHSANDDDNPFADFADAEDDMQTTETFVTATTTATELYRIERVSRQFTPTRPDEIAVAPGDEVRVLKHFDDGWAYAEHVSTSRKGLFPIDCLRMPDEDLPAFLSKRLSGYSGWVRPPSAVVMHH